MTKNDKINYVIIIVLVILLVITNDVRSSNEKEYNELVDKYDELEAEYSIYKSDVSRDFWTMEDYRITLFSYFEQDEDYTFDIAKDAFQHLETIMDKYVIY